MPYQEFLIPLAIVILVVFAVLTDRWDRSRIRAHMSKAGYWVVSIEKAPFMGQGLIRGKDRSYRVTYLRRDGSIAVTVCKTSAAGGVYWRGGTPPESAPDDPRVSPTSPPGDAPPPVSTESPGSGICCPQCGCRFQIPEETGHNPA